ncbi:PREDICTED: coiled-coil domain-containing protein KIAA1407 homolog [Cyprinodon variegatus]|uniref:coiled-coil domain-containing protein KIAA1407 homolog n=1 Tax=Cyprinodon variegatus TaxID=28743 RepID=UPI000742B1BC|nr:PREDICTED: coiled-coil domain-containing protein KIAA1407 homolog [Cyprinodon variegatus]
MSTGQKSHLFRWKRLVSPNKKLVKKDDIEEWRKRVEMASEFAISEVFSLRKPQSGVNRGAELLQSSEELMDHDDAYSEAQALLDNWLSDKLRTELDMEDKDDQKGHVENTQSTAIACPQLTPIAYKRFDDLYSCLVEEEEQFAVQSFLQDLRGQELLDSGTKKGLSLDDRERLKRFRNPIVTMEARHQQVRENRARREAEKQRKQMEKEEQRDARKEAKRREKEEEMRRKQQEHREEEMVQQEMIRLRKLKEEKKSQEHFARLREKEKKVQRACRSVESTPTLPSKQQLQNCNQLQREQRIQTRIDMINLKCLHRHLSGWYSLVLKRRLHIGKAEALCDWRRQLKAWQAWRAVVWAEHNQREAARTEEQLRTEKRQNQLAVESDRRRLLRRFLNEWQLWCRTEKSQRELLAQQHETKAKMGALINAASTGKLPVIAAPADSAVSLQQELRSKEYTGAKDPCAAENEVLNASNGHQDKNSVAEVGRPLQPWQVTRRHTAPTTAQLHHAHGRTRENRVLGSECRSESRKAVQQQIIAQQRKLLKEQQEQIAQLKEKQSIMGLELDMEKAAQLTQLKAVREEKSCSFGPGGQRAPGAKGEPRSQSAPPREAVMMQTCPHPIVTAMETRARQRAERRQEIEEIKRRKEEAKLAELKAAEEQRQREEEEERRKAAEKRREEKKLEREREAERQRLLKRHQDLMRVACQHRNRTLLSHRGLAPWKRLIQLKHANMEMAETHHNLLLLRRCTLGWLQFARESLCEKEASADRLHQHFLLRRSLNGWKRLGELRIIQEERAEHFYRIRTLRRFLLALLQHVSQERLVKWDRRTLAQEHHDRHVLQRCFQAWRQLPCVLRKEREREVRREKLSRKVAELLPDFCLHPL